MRFLNFSTCVLTSLWRNYVPTMETNFSFRLSQFLRDQNQFVQASVSSRSVEVLDGCEHNRMV